MVSNIRKRKIGDLASGIQRIIMSLTFTPLRISTLVTTGHLGSIIQIKSLFKQIKHHLIPIGYPQEGILKMECEMQVIGYSARDLLTKRRVSEKTFFNQGTIVIRKIRDNEKNDFKEVNVKIFANGGFQMTGVTNEEFSKETILWLIHTLNTFTPAISTTPLELKKFSVQLLNSDYKMNALVKRAELHKILCETYHLSSTLETTIYQGVNTKYYYNEQSPAENPRGICNCPRFCSGQGDGTAIGSCKRITIAVFQTGSIIITGARSKKQLNEAYEYMNGIIQIYEKDVTRPLMETPGCVKNE
jgi:TATA-box binding protein (TBP) (component of TFIID and TFIIIB)